MKKKYLLALLIQPFLFAQIGINKTNINANSVFETGATNQGILFPRIKTVQSLTDVSFLKTPTVPSGLTIYNEGTPTGTNSDIGSGFYYWENAKWNYIIDFKNITSRLTVNQLFSVTSSGNSPLNVSSFTTEAAQLPAISYQETPTAGKTWSLIPETTMDFTVTENTNYVQMFGSGNAQSASNNTITTGSQKSRTLTFNIGIFIKKSTETNYHLYSVGTFGTGEVSTCSIIPYITSSTITNLSPGTYSVALFAYGRKNYYTVGTTNTEYGANSNLTFGGHNAAGVSSNNGACNNTDKVNMRSNLNIVVTNIKN